MKEEHVKALPADLEGFILLVELSGGSTRGATCRFHVMIKGEEMDSFQVVTYSDSFGIKASDIDICNDLIMFVGDNNEIIAVFPINETIDSIKYIARFNEKHKIQNKFKVSTEDLGATVYEASNVSIRNNIITLTDDDNKILYIFPTKRLRYIMQEGKGEVLNNKY